MTSFRVYASTVAIFAVVLFVALVIGVFGQITLWTGAEVIPERGAGLLLGTGMVTVSALIMLASMLLRGLRVPPAEQRVGIGMAILTGLLSLLGYVLVGSIAFGASHDGLASLVVFAGRNVISPFALSVGLISAIVTFFYTLVLASRVGRGGAPRWPWDHGD